MKKILSFLLIFIFVFGVFGVCSVAADNEITSFYLEKIPDTKRNEHIVTYISVKDNEGFNAVTFELNYDAEKLSFIPPSKDETVNYDNEVAGGLEITYGPQKTGTQRILVNKNDITDFTYNGKLFKLEFEILNAVSEDEVLNIGLVIPSNGRAVSAEERYVDATAEGTTVKAIGKFGWYEIDGKKYYYTNNGVRVYGNYEVDGIMYSFDQSGVLIGKYNGMLIQDMNARYFTDGIAQKGIVKDSEKVYYFDAENGYLVAESKYIDGVYYTIDKSTATVTAVQGDATGDFKVDATDLVRLKKFLAGQKVTIYKNTADVTGDSSVDATDLVRLKKYLSGQKVLLQVFEG